MTMRFLSVCSGIEAASAAWKSLGWQAVAYSEIEPFACAVLAHHYPDVPNIGDMTKIKGEEYHGAVDLIVGGTPCQDFSVAGKRAGMAGERGRLALYYLRLVDYVSPRWIVWENVPGVLSSNGGRDFALFAGTLAKLGYGWSYRVLDAQYFGVPQRRRRVFLVGHFGDWRPAAAVLFEPHCLRRDTPPRREARKDVACTIEASFGRSRGAGQNPSGIIPALTGRLGGGGPDDNKAQGGFYVADVAPTLRAGSSIGEDVDTCESLVGYVPEIVSQALSCKWSKGTGGPAGDEHHNLVAPPLTGNPYGDHESREGLLVPMPSRGTVSDLAYALTNPGSGVRTHSRQILAPRSRVRRLTPRECERLQGFPDDYTAIVYRGKPAADAPRYRALGNSMAVPVMRWIGERINHIIQERA